MNRAVQCGLEHKKAMTTVHTDAKPAKADKPRFPRDEIEMTSILLREHPEASLEELFEALEDIIGLNTCLDRHVILLRGYIKRGLKDAMRELQPTAKSLDGITKLKRKPQDRVTDPKAREAHKAAAKAAARQALSLLVRDESIRLLDQVLPTGKTIGKTTIAEYTQYSDVQANLRAKIQKLGPPEALIEDVITEKAFSALFDACNKS
jgi:hypothetical protein